RMAGSAHGSRKSIADLEELAAALNRPARQRTTTYGPVSAERHQAARRDPGISGTGRTVLPLLA
ncbi:MAG: hypothetical protein ACQSGP_13945, partial [Frankia sp.]